MASAFEDLAQRGLLRVQDPTLAAHHFIWLVFGVPRNKVMLCGDQIRFSPAELRRYADAGTRAFLAIYGTEPTMPA